MGILDFLCLGGIAEVGGIVGPTHFAAAVGAQRQAQVHLAVFRAVIVDFQRRRWRQIGGDIEHCAVRQDAPRTGDGDLAQAQVLVVQLQFAEPVEGCIEATEALVQGCFACPSRLLEVLRFYEQAFRPKDRVT
ncbi:hypothetical protein D9M71_716330 [compost metagenome]